MPVATGSEGVVGVGVDQRELSADLGERRGTTNFVGLYHPVPNKVLLISVPTSIETYIEEGWHESK